jgi:molybdenum cofactor biosynthesis protein B
VPLDEFIPLHCAVLTVSDTRDATSDRSGPLVAERLEAAGHEIVERAIVPDEIARIRSTLRRWIEGNAVDVVVSTGGTGMRTRDVTPEAIEPLVSKAIPGFGELFRMLSYEEIGTSTLQSRVGGALCGQTFVFWLPGSSNACRTALDKILVQQLDARHRPCNFAELVPRLLPDRSPLQL